MLYKFTSGCTHCAHTALPPPSAIIMIQDLCHRHHHHAYHTPTAPTAAHLKALLLGQQVVGHSLKGKQQYTKHDRPRKKAGVGQHTAPLQQQGAAISSSKHQCV